MGYRLKIAEVEPEYNICGGKLYGYISKRKLRKLKSYKWLKKHGYVTRRTIWDYGYNNICMLDAVDFRDFWQLYMQDCNNIYKEDFKMEREEIECFTSDKDKLISWG